MQQNNTHSHSSTFMSSLESIINISLNVQFVVYLKSPQFDSRTMRGHSFILQREGN